MSKKEPMKLPQIGKCFEAVCTLLKTNTEMNKALHQELVAEALRLLDLIPQNALGAGRFSNGVTVSPIELAFHTRNMDIIEAVFARRKDEVIQVKRQPDLSQMAPEHRARAILLWAAFLKEDVFAREFVTFAFQIAKSRDVKTLKEFIIHVQGKDIYRLHMAQTQFWGRTLSQMPQVTKGLMLDLLIELFQQPTIVESVFNDALRNNAPDMAFLALKAQPEHADLFCRLYNMHMETRSGTPHPILKHLSKEMSTAHGQLKMRSSAYDTLFLFDGQKGGFAKNFCSYVDLPDMKAARKFEQQLRQKQRGRDTAT